MIDYLLAFASKAARAAAFPVPEEIPSAVCWNIDGIYTIMPVDVIIRPAEYDLDGNITVTPVYSQATWLAIRTEERSETVESMQNCLVCTDTVLAAKKQPFVYFCKIPGSTPIGAVTPVFAGDMYQFPYGAPASILDQYKIS